ncbi:arsenate reductase ArsC [Iodobacter sp. CM08]|uniref:arsenate reductase ArsC n=1 Tax=Iodobacter sp. CM08 TaxID=3085902 RepID=UPI0029814285|nr:arsenate reductase ArsC [Iodobacter sp. CM08]MDW5415575.1 arsenate reductase ArsC [Iodobacter sp. CM08]
MSKIYNVLFICTGNSARSQIAEAVLNHVGKGRFQAYSAGSQPAGSVNPLAIEALQHVGISTEKLRSKSWQEFSAADAPQMDFVFTLCDSAAGEACPVWPGHPTLAHWGVAAPGTGGNETIQHKVFHDTLLILKRRIDLFTALPVEKLDALALKLQVSEIGQSL